METEVNPQSENADPAIEVTEYTVPLYETVGGIVTSPVYLTVSPVLGKYPSGTPYRIRRT